MSGQYGVPGQTEAVFANQREIFWGGGADQIEVLRSSAHAIDASAADAGNSITTTLRAGLLLGLVTATGKLRQYDPGASDGTEDVYGVLDVEVSMLDENGATVDRWVPVVVSAPVKSKELLIEGNALLGDAAEAAAVTGLEAKFFRLSHRLC